MKLIPALLTLSLAAAVSTYADSYSFKESFAATHPLRPGGVLSLANVNGDVEIRTWDRAEIRIEGEKSARTDEELKLIQLTIEPSPERVAIEVKLPKRPGSWFGGSEIRAAVHFTITVPADARLDEIKTVNGGVAIDGVRGSIRASSVNGHVKAAGLMGDARLVTTNGGIDARAVSLPTGSKLELRSVNGGVTLELPKAIAATLNASSVNGGVDCDFPITISGRAKSRNLRGTIGGGGADLKVTTVNGGIRIRALRAE